VAGEEPTFERLGLSIPALRGSRTLTEVVRELDAVNVEPKDVALRKPTLDDVFLTLTGHKAETEGESEPAESGTGSDR
jgi:ABC-2 type transport system ATP-binding protein